MKHVYLCHPRKCRSLVITPVLFASCHSKRRFGPKNLAFLAVRQRRFNRKQALYNAIWLGLKMKISIRPVWLGAIALMLVTAGCRYSDIGVGKSPDMTPQQAEDDAKYAYSELPVRLEEQPGTGRAVQPDRMVTVDLAFSYPDGKRTERGRIRFLHSARSVAGPALGDTFGYVSPALLAAMAGMREGGSRRVKLTDSLCSDKYPYPSKCEIFGNMYEAKTSGSIFYPRGTETLVTISIVRVCRPTIIEEHYPDVMGGGAGRKIRESSCR